MTAGKTEKNKQITTIISLIIANKFQLEKNEVKKGNKTQNKTAIKTTTKQKNDEEMIMK